jgi:hypothetical protein
LQRHNLVWLPCTAAQVQEAMQHVLRNLPLPTLQNSAKFLPITPAIFLGRQATRHPATDLPLGHFFVSHCE